MDSVNLNQFRDDFQDCINRVVFHQHPLKVVDQEGSSFIVISAEEWEHIQETLYVLQNTDLMQQIAHSLTTHDKQQGYHPSTQDINEILSI